jgi:C-terminal processing protease CtpA/Prc
MLEQILNPLDETKKKEFTINLGDVVLANLNPFGRSRLYTTKKQQALQNEIKNIDPKTNLYDILGVAKTASSDEIKKAWAQKSEPLKNNPSLEAQAKLADLNRAYQALGTTETKQKYDQVGAEPIIFTKITPPDIAYLSIKKISPTILQEFQKAVNELDKQTALNTLILDLRDNIGGDIDTLPYFLGFFLGSNQYAYETFHQGETKPFKTAASLLPSLTRYKKIVVLINNGTQSSAEVIAATFKKYHIGVIIGEKSRGWGTIESIYPLSVQIDQNETYSMLMVHDVTLRDDGQPIEGRGVEPAINLSDVKWSDKLLSYFNYPALVETIKEVTKKVTTPNK